MAEDLKICKECKHCKFMLTSLGYMCTHPKVAVVHANLVNGKKKYIYQYCIHERDSWHNTCGPRGELFERK